MNSAQIERLVLLIEECGEVIQAATKVLRHGYDGKYDNGEDNRAVLERELGDVDAIISLMNARGDIDAKNILAHSFNKDRRLAQFTYFQGKGPNGSI